jgi:aminomethyltransferase
VGQSGWAPAIRFAWEMKMALYGNDIWEKTNPLEAGLGWVTKLDKGDFIGRDGPDKSIKDKGVNPQTVAFDNGGRVFSAPALSYFFEWTNKSGRLPPGVISPA